MGRLCFHLLITKIVDYILSTCMLNWARSFCQPYHEIPNMSCKLGQNMGRLIALPFYMIGREAKMAQYHHFWKFLTRKHCFGNNQQSTTFSRTRVSETRVPLQFSTVALLSWIYAIKKFFVVLELGKLEYHLHSTRVYQARVPFS